MIPIVGQITKAWEAKEDTDQSKMDMEDVKRQYGIQGALQIGEYLDQTYGTGETDERTEFDAEKAQYGLLDLGPLGREAQKFIDPQSAKMDEDKKKTDQYMQHLIDQYGTEHFHEAVEILKEGPNGQNAPDYDPNAQTSQQQKQPSTDQNQQKMEIPFNPDTMASSTEEARKIREQKNSQDFQLPNIGDLGEFIAQGAQKLSEGLQTPMPSIEKLGTQSTIEDSASFDI